MSALRAPDATASPFLGNDGIASLPSFLRAYGHEVRNHVGTMRNGLYLLRLQVDPAASPLLELLERQLAAMLDSYRLLSDAERLLAEPPVAEARRVDLAEWAAVVASRAGAGRRGIEVRVAGGEPVVVGADAQRVALAFEIYVAEALACAPDDSVVAIVTTATAAGGTLAIRYPGNAGTGAAQDARMPASAHALLLAVADVLVREEGGAVVHERGDATGQASYVLEFPRPTGAAAARVGIR